MKSAAAASLFERAYPAYGTTRMLDELRAREYPALAGLDCTYLDYTAANLYATSQLERHSALLRDHVFGNPHSTNPTSSFSTSSIARARQRVLAFFNAPPDEWAVIFDTEPDMFWAPVNEIDDVLVDEQMHAAGAFVDVPEADGPTARVASPSDFYGTPWTPRGPAPKLGQHTREVLAGLGRTDDEIDALMRAGVVADLTEQYGQSS